MGIEGLITEFLCDSVMTVSWTCLNSTIFTLLCIAIDRYRAIVTPMKRQISINQARMMILLAWSLAFVYSSNLIVVNGITSRTVEIVGRNFTNRECGYLPSEQVELVVVLDFVLLYFLPLIALTVLYSKMITVLYFGNSPNDNSRRRKRRAIRMLIVVVAMFALTWCPIRILRMFRYVASSWMPEYRYYRIHPVIVSVAFANSWMNPIIYAIFGANFRREFSSIFGCGGRRNGGYEKRGRDHRRRSNKELAQIELDPDREPGQLVGGIDHPDVTGDRFHATGQAVATQTEDHDIASGLDCQCHANVAFESSAETQK
ncbi:QRFP-like peptide receptor [Ptychodera flava]|uniref:QRFP-like peptide receptor n=1 Tax=Ptychodera flava TaxID=63121 RepID=UPI00396A23C5